MNYQEEFQKIMREESEIVIATSVKEIPNVRIVNFYYDEKQPGVIYFMTGKDSQKIKEFKMNDQVAITSVPRKGEGYIQSRKGKAVESHFSVDEMAEHFIGKIPGYDEVIQMMKESLVVYEIHVKEVQVILGMEEEKEISLY